MKRKKKEEREIVNRWLKIHVFTLTRLINLSFMSIINFFNDVIIYKLFSFLVLF